MVRAEDKVRVLGHEYGEEVEDDVHDAGGKEAVDDEGALGVRAAVAGVGRSWECRYVC